MRKKMWLASTLAAFLLTAGSVQAQSVNDKIQSLEQELQQLKESQIELKKEATAAAAAMPSFSFRPGNGLSIEAADKSWSFRTGVEAHFRYNFIQGRDQVGRSNGEFEGRRFRPDFHLCVNNCLWEIDWRLDLDGFGGNTALQRAAINIDGPQINPWLPKVHFGMDTSSSGPVSLARQGSGNTGAQAEYDMLSQALGFNTGSGSSGVGLTWENMSLNSIGIPGRIANFQVGMNAYGEGGDGAQIKTDKKDFHLYTSIQPFSQSKNKWVSGLTFEYGAWFCNSDNRADANGCNVVRIQTNAKGGRQTLFTTGANSIGDGLTVQQGPGLVWNVGPYTLRTMVDFQRSEDRGTGIAGTAALGRGQKKARVFLIGHDVYLWSPKGFLTGSSTDAGSILAGYHFERTDVSVGCNGSTGIACPVGLNAASSTAASQFHRNAVRLNEWDLWYVMSPRMNVGVNFLWTNASNLRNGLNQEGHNIGVCKRTSSTATGCRVGVDGDWTEVFLNWRWTF